MVDDQVKSFIHSCETVLSEWSQRPLSALFRDADSAPSGVSFDRLRIGDRTIALVVCIVIKYDYVRQRIPEEVFTTFREQSRDEIQNDSLALLLNAPIATTGTVVGFFRNPETVLFASLNPVKIQKLESDWIANINTIETKATFVPLANTTM